MKYRIFRIMPNGLTLATDRSSREAAQLVAYHYAQAGLRSWVECFDDPPKTRVGLFLWNVFSDAELEKFRRRFAGLQMLRNAAGDLKRIVQMHAGKTATALYVAFGRRRGLEMVKQEISLNEEDELLRFGEHRKSSLPNVKDEPRLCLAWLVRKHET